MDVTRAELSAMKRVRRGGWTATVLGAAAFFAVLVCGAQSGSTARAEHSINACEIEEGNHNEPFCRSWVSGSFDGACGDDERTHDEPHLKGRTQAVTQATHRKTAR